MSETCGVVYQNKIEKLCILLASIKRRNAEVENLVSLAGSYCLICKAF